MPMVPSSSQNAVTRMTGTGNGVTPVCPLAMRRSLGWLIFASPEAVKIAASNPCKVHSSAFMMTSCALTTVHMYDVAAARNVTGRVD
jgi:hypothetical protein